MLFFCICFSTLLYLKFLLVWAMVILADFILEFRFEFLWPFWLLLRSVYDSFKYQGLVSTSMRHSARENAAVIRTVRDIIKCMECYTSVHLSVSGLLRIFYLYCAHIGHDLLFFHPRALVVLRRQHLCLGAICLAHRYTIKQTYLR